MDIIHAFSGKIPILGVCLGHQAIAYSYSATIIKGTFPMHGKISHVTHDNRGIFQDIPSPFKVTRYHSLIVDEKSLPSLFSITATSDDGVIMGISNEDLHLYGVQFHPEAVLTEYGHQLLKNFIHICKDIK